MDDNKIPGEPAVKMSPTPVGSAGTTPGLAAATVALMAILARLPALGAWWNQDDWGLLGRAAGLVPAAPVPVRWLSQTLYWDLLWPLAGLDPVPYAWTRLLLHAAAAAGLVRLAARLGLTPLQSWLAGLVLAASPLAFLPLYWAAGVQDLLAVVLAVWALERWLAPGRLASILALMLAVGAVAAKETVVGLPILLAALLLLDPRRRRDRLAWSLVGLLLLAAAAASVLALRHFDTASLDPYALGDPTSTLSHLLVYGWWLLLPGPVFPPDPGLVQFLAGGCVWLAWTGWSVHQWRRGRQVPAFALLGALVTLAPLLPLRTHLAPDLAYPVEPFGCLVLASLVPGRWQPRQSLVMVLCVVAVLWGFLGMRARLDLRAGDGLPADPLVRRTAVSWSVCQRLPGLPLDADGLVIVQPPLLPETARSAEELGERWVTGSLLYHSLGGTLGPRLVLGERRPVIWANGLRETPTEAFVILDAGGDFKPWGPTRQALLYQTLTDVGLGLYPRAQMHLLRAGLLGGDTLIFGYDPSLLPISLEQILGHKEGFIDYLAASRRQGRSLHEIAGLQENFFSLLSICTGLDVDTLKQPGPDAPAAPGPEEDR